MTPHPTKPKKAVVEEKYLKDGRKLGAELKSRARHAKFVER